jgi:hypothetical protein
MEGPACAVARLRTPVTAGAKSPRALANRTFWKALFAAFAFGRKTGGLHVLGDLVDDLELPDLLEQGRALPAQPCPDLGGHRA